ncbi:DUF4179 domain-containing protein [Paenibacillus xylanilyticus]|uniref:DUF4179 domain-containing protein n=1 Tax=Paenibacillus xylanilyticus TaxID=248903 RepID=A0A7Y6C1K2_9BACL|nr:DUF4179 domain-containing protein [Paenibacillus xylanilyticus]NUU78453.1 DUF4179 domain-containing protein [Paenibacillus xylanilyticus]
MKPIPNDEDRLWEQHLFREEPEPDFTLQVMKKLDGVSMEREAEVNFFVKKSSKTHWMRRMGVTAAAVVILAGGAWFARDYKIGPEQPAVNAVNNPPLPNIPVPEELKYSYLADDYKRLKPLGLVVNPNIHIEDQGYTLKIEDVLVDRSQIVLTVQQNAPDGSTIYSVNPEMGRIHVTDEEGREVATLARDTRSSGGSLDKFIFQLHDDIPDEVVVRGELGHLNVGGQYNFETKSYEDKETVDWSFQFNIDMTKAKSLAVEAPMNNTYTTPEGLKLDMTQLVRTPNGTRLDMNVSLDDQLRDKVGEDWEKHMDILYHIEIPETNEYRIFNGSRAIARYAKFRLRDTSQLSQNGGQMKLSETWDPALVTVNAKNIRFVLDGYTIPVKAEKGIEVDLDKRRTEPNRFYTFARFEQFGDEVLLFDYNYEPVYNASKGGLEEKSSLVLEGSGRFRNEISGDKWVAVDRHGTEYPVEVIGIVDKPDQNEEYIVDDFKLMIHGFYKENGTKFTLKRTVVHRDFRDVNWAVDLPSFKSLPWE